MASESTTVWLTAFWMRAERAASNRALVRTPASFGAYANTEATAELNTCSANGSFPRSRHALSIFSRAAARFSSTVISGEGVPRRASINASICSPAMRVTSAVIRVMRLSSTFAPERTCRMRLTAPTAAASVAARAICSRIGSGDWTRWASRWRSTYSRRSSAVMSLGRNLAPARSITFCIRPTVSRRACSVACLIPRSRSLMSGVLSIPSL